MEQKIKAVVFDMDGVLFDTERLYMDAWKEAASKMELADDKIEETIHACVGLNNTDTKALFMRKYGEEFPFEEYIGLTRELFHETVTRDGLPVKPGAREILHYLKKAGYKIALATSTSKDSATGHLQSTGLYEYFAELVTGDMVEHSKPDPEIYKRACEAIYVKPENAIAIEDSYNGIRSAHGAGMMAIMVPDLLMPIPEIEALLYAKCDSLFEVMDLIKEKAAEDGCAEVLRISLDQLNNTRDLGGFTTIDGRRIKKHRLLRSGALGTATKEDINKLVSEYELKVVVDFRTKSEKAAHLDPDIEGVLYVENPLLEDKAMGITREEEKTKDPLSVIIGVVEGLAKTGKTPLAYMQDMYRNLLTNPFSRAGYKKFFEILLSQKEGAVLWHCSAGKDRVGVGTLLLLTALGVDKKQIMADYLKTNVFGCRDVDKLMKDVAAGMGDDFTKAAEEDAIRLLFTVDAAYAESIFDMIDADFGGMDAFLEKEMGLTEEKRKQLQDNYLE